MIKYEVRVGENGYKGWYLNGKRHREDGPAVEYSTGTKQWYLNDKLHREDGPAIEYSDGHKGWYLNGKRLSEAEWRKQVSKTSCEGREIEIDGVTYVLKLKGQDDE